MGRFANGHSWPRLRQTNTVPAHFGRNVSFHNLHRALWKRKLKSLGSVSAFVLLTQRRV
jgi:hypothetical protein